MQSKGSAYVKVYLCILCTLCFLIEFLLLVMRKAFQMFDTNKSGFIETAKISTILNTMGQLFDDVELRDLINENDPNGKFNFFRLFVRVNSKLSRLKRFYVRCGLRYSVRDVYQN